MFMRPNSISAKRSVLPCAESVAEASGAAYADNALACEVVIAPNGSGGRDSADTAIAERVRRAHPSPWALVGAVPRNRTALRTGVPNIAVVYRIV